MPSRCRTIQDYGTCGPFLPPLPRVFLDIASFRRSRDCASVTSERQIAVPENPAVSILVVNYNSGVHLGNALSGLAGQSFGNVEVIVIDNASSDGSFAHASAAFGEDSRFVFLQAPSNLGFAAGNNL